MPRVDFADPRLLTPNYGSIIPGISQGLGVAGQFAQIADDVQSRPIRRQLQQIQLQEAQARLGQIPLQQQIAELNLGRMSQPIENVVGAGIEEVPRYEIQPMVDETGAAMYDEFGVPRTERPAGMDVFATEQVEVFDPVTRTRKTVTRRAKPLQTMEQAATAETAKEATQALIAQRSRGKEFETEALISGYQEALDSGDTGTAALYKNLLDRKAAMPGGLAAGTIYGREIEKNAARIGLTQQQAANLAETPEGASAMAKLAQQQAVIKAGRSFIPPSLRLNAAEQAAINGMEAPAALQAAETVRAETPVGDALPRPATKAQRDALPPGTKYIAPDGKTYIKG